MQTVNFVEVRFVVTVRQIIENWPKGQVFWCCCSRIVTDTYDALRQAISFRGVPEWDSLADSSGRDFAIRCKKAPV